MDKETEARIAGAHSVGFSGGEYHEWERFVILAEMLSDIRAALTEARQPKVVSREWVETRVRENWPQYGQAAWDDVDEICAAILRELGYTVEEPK